MSRPERRRQAKANKKTIKRPKLQVVPPRSKRGSGWDFPLDIREKLLESGIDQKWAEKLGITLVDEADLITTPRGTSAFHIPYHDWDKKMILDFWRERLLPP